MRLYIARHGETLWNREKRLQGSTDVELNEKGIALAELTGKALAQVPFHRVFASPLKRAVVTAQLMTAGKELPFETDERLKEISFGKWEGCCIAPEHPEVPLDLFRKFFLDPASYEPEEEGESIAGLCARTGEFLEELLENPSYREETILIVVHGAVTRALMQNLLGGDQKDFWRGQVPPNCGINVIDITDGKATLVEKDKTYDR